MRLDTNVARWAVTVIELSRTKRHLDRAALMVFWEHLDKYLSIHRTFKYAYNTPITLPGILFLTGI